MSALHTPKSSKGRLNKQYNFPDLHHFPNRYFRADEGTELDIALLNDTTSICGDEVILITDNQAMNLKNDASLKYDTLGSSNIQQYALNTKISQASSVKNEMHQIMVPNGKRADITFSDGTRIYINSGSKVIYPDIFEERKREILVEGEVYLDESKRKDCPFVVKMLLVQLHLQLIPF